MSTYTHNATFFAADHFYINEEPRTGIRTIEKTTLEAFLREWHEGDPARAWHVKEVISDKPVWNNDVNGEQEERYNDGSREQSDLPDEWAEVTTFEVRERDNSRMSGHRLIATFETEVEANEYHLNGLYWNYCESNRITDAPYSGTKEECENELRELAAQEAENAAE